MARGGSAQARCRSRLDGLAEDHARILQKLFGPQSGLGDNFHGPVFERLECGLRTLFRKRGANDDWYRVLGHDLLQERQAVHAGHLNIQRDHVRNLLAHPLGGYEGIAGGADYLNGRV